MIATETKHTILVQATEQTLIRVPKSCSLGLIHVYTLRLNWKNAHAVVQMVKRPALTKLMFSYCKFSIGQRNLK